MACAPRLGALSGILATITFPPLHRCMGLVATGGLSVWLQLACLLAGVAPAVAAALGAGIAAQPHMYALVWGLVLSRFGLWSFDLAGGLGSRGQALQHLCCHLFLQHSNSAGSVDNAALQSPTTCDLVSDCMHMHAHPWPAANQLIQETVDHSALGAVSGVQGSLQSLFQASRARELDGGAVGSYAASYGAQE